MQKISAVLIVYNEENNITDCLKNIQPIADEIIVMDGFSTDQTVQKARSFTEKIFQQKFKGFGRQKQDAVARASHEWILQIDADERCSAELIEEITQKKKSLPSHAAGYSIPFQFYFMSKYMRFGGCQREYHVRLFKKSLASYGGKTIHEGIQIHGAVEKLKNPVLHHSYENLEDYFTKCNLYTSLIAHEKYQSGKRFHCWQIGRFPFEFILRYFIKLGILDGMPGLIFAMLSSWYAFMKHVKLWEIEYRNKKRLHL